jgi:hypothetical protein
VRGAAIRRRFRARNQATTCSVIVLDYTSSFAENSCTSSPERRTTRLRSKGNVVQYLPGWTVQCINVKCGARGHWLRADSAPKDH